MKVMIDNRTWKDPTPGLPETRQGKLTGMVVFKTISDLVIECVETSLCILTSRSHPLVRIINRFKTALQEYPQLSRLVENLNEWFEIWATGVQSPLPTFRDPVTSNRSTCNYTVLTLRATIERLGTIIEREHYSTESKRVVRKRPVPSAAEKTQALLMCLEQTYDPPGDLRPGGPRHSNDFTDIAQIRICPTSDELMCPVPPYLPVIGTGARHHLPAGSMEKHLDMHFRLLREDLT